MLHTTDSPRHSLAFLVQVLDTLPAAAYTCDVDGLITYCNRNAIDVWGRVPRINDSSDRYCGSYKLFFADGRPMRHDECWMARALIERGPFNGQEVLIEQPDGRLRSALAHANPMLDEDGRFVGASNVLVDITDRKQFEERLAYQATHDALTGLPNRSLLLRTIEQALEEAGATGRRFALLLLDLDRFKVINDTFGHGCGDEVLRRTAPRLKHAVGDRGLVARLGGDEFGILLSGADRPAAERAAATILRAVARPIPIDGRTFDVGTSIGIALCPEHGRDAATLLQHADVAMYAAKRSRSGAALYADDRQEATSSRASTAAELRAAIRGGGLTLHYQPILDLATRKVVAVEALARWPHPERGLIPPGEFVPLAEAEGLSTRLDLWALGEALRRRRGWRRQGLDLAVSVNLSTASLLDEAFVEAAFRLLVEEPGPLGGLTLEMSERGVLEDPARVKTALDRFRSRGVRAALDDFGSGSSSLAHLKQLRVDELKLDPTVVRGLPASRPDAGIAEAVLGLGRSLDLIVTAEGVEHPEALDWLAARGCDRVQGFHLSPPRPPDELRAWLASPTQPSLPPRRRDLLRADRDPASSRG
ncbi:putative bifunctional diguanylate cyclase/phosphodiesterase [Paludisphaera mucosa]|uniref:EAL domain-containing protein n=1 Tax=Paludisphaera mucosa TaxID=3030827 RepID=A0ABT6FA03_9BACT|nr:EAL domain-containing protein [Paludisphaera mucosa]MDG3004433.1 EAL domain-containing protein [Paludisphaera mucosa]